MIYHLNTHNCHAQPCVNIERVMYNQTPNMQIGLNVFKNLFSAFIPYRECTSCISDIDIVNHPGPEFDRQIYEDHDMILSLGIC